MAGLLDGILPYLYSRSDAMKREVKGLLGDPLGTLQREVGYTNDRAGGLLDVTRAATDEGMRYGPATQRLAGILADSYNPVGMMAGVGAKTADKAALALAQKLEAQGLKPDRIWKETGWGKGPDGLWRFEIDDSAASFRPNALQQFNDYGVRKQRSVFGHHALFEAYPELAQTPVMRMNVKPDSPYGGVYRNNMVELNIPRIKPDMAKAGSINIHELQHAIQDREGFAPGGALEDFIAGARKNPATGQQFTMAEAFNSYQRLAGEAEARMVQDRIPMSAAQRRDIYPWDPLSFQWHSGVPLSGLLMKP